MGPTQAYDLSDYLAMARRHWWIVVFALLMGGLAGADYNRRLPREYVATASVLVYPAGQDANVAGGRTRAEINLDTEAQLVRSTAVATSAAQALGRDDVEQLAAGIYVEVPPNTSVLQIKFTDQSAHGAQAGARAFATAYLRNREDNAKAVAAKQVEALKGKVAELTAELTSINNQLAGVNRSSPTFASLDSQRETALGAINHLHNKITQVGTETTSGGVIIRDARLPGKPVRPNTPVNIAAGALLGLLLGIAIAGLRERLDRRVRSSSELRGRCGMPVLGEISDRQVPADDVYPPFGDGGRAFNRLRNEVVAALNPSEQVVVITGASSGTAVTHVAANLAAALARTGTDVVLLGAHTPESMTQGSPLARLLGVASTPGLSDVLAGKANLGEATQRAARNPTLRVITAGGTASAAGLLQSQALKDIIATLRANTGYLVIEAPSTSTGADAQSLASLADAAIIAVELRRTLRPDIADATEQLRRVGTPVLGAVVMPRLKPPTENASTPDQPDRLGGKIPEVAWQSTPEGGPETWIARQNADGGDGRIPHHDQTVLMSKLDEAHGPA